MNNKNIILCGVGGQGTVLASKLLAAAAMARGMEVMSAETIGMAQKGGSVFSHLRMGKGLVSPMMAKGTCDLMIAFEPAEAVRMLPYLAPDGCLVVSTRAVMPVTATLAGGAYKGEDMLDYLRRNVKNLIVVDTDAGCLAAGSPRAANMVLLGAAVRGGALEVSIEDIVAAMKARVKPAFWEMNEKALFAAPVEHK